MTAKTSATPSPLLIFSRHAGLAGRFELDLDCQQFDALEDPDSLEASAFVVDMGSMPRPVELLRRLRTHPEQGKKLIWLHGEASPEARALSDGDFADVARPAEQIRRSSEKLAVANNGRPAEDQDDRLLSLLWSHPDLRLEPVADWQAPQLYRYPLLEALQEEGEPEYWLRSLRLRRLLEGIELVDRVRLCPACNHGHLSFIDVCTECRSLDIRSELGLHCFSCGHVGPQHTFQQEGMLSCPNCLAVLRHIGQDYDRPMENHVCNSCDHMFMDGDVLARCLGCGQTHPPNNLEAQAIQRFRLSESGRLAARTGELDDIYQIFNEINHVSPEYFELFCDWSIKLQKRHPEITFGILMIQLNAMPTVIDSLGHSRAAALVDGVAERVKALIRTTDLITRTGDERLWILLPQTEVKGVHVLAERLEALLVDAVADISIDRLGSVYHLASTDILEGEDAAALMARLASASI